MDTGDDEPGRLIPGTAEAAMMDDGIKVFRKDLHAAAATVGSKVRGRCFTSGETARHIGLAGTFRSTWWVRARGLTMPTK